MKFLFALTFLVATNSSLALAMPKIGDYAAYDVVLNQESNSFVGTVSWELTAYDSATKVFTRHTIMILNGNTQVSDDAVSESNLFNDTTVYDALAHCSNYKGVLVPVTTSAGTFNTCSVPVRSSQGSGNDWVANVPFGLVKWTVVATNGDTVSAAIRDYHDVK
jgi:hypothetical protein